MSDHEAQLAALRQDLADARRENRELRQQIARLTMLVAEQNERLGEITSILRRREDQLSRVPRSQRPDEKDEDPDPDPPSGAPGGAASSDEPSPAKGRRGQPRKPRTKGGRSTPGAHLPTDELRVANAGCGHCGSTRLLARDQEITYKYTVVPSYVRRLRLVRDVCRCAECGLVSTAPMPPMPCPRSLFTCEFLAWLVVQRFVLLVPLDRIRNLLASQGVHVPISTLVSLVALAAELLDAIDGEHWKQLKAGPAILTDGTGMKVLIDGMKKAWLGNLDVFSYGNVVVYLFAMTKHGDAFARLFEDFVGSVVCDAESRLDAVFADGTRKEANCNAHPRRKFRDATASQPRLARRAGQFLLAMYVLEAKAKKRGLTGAALLAWRQRRTRPIVDRFRRWLEEIEPTLLRTDPFGRVVRYYLRHFAALTAFVDDAALPIDNNQSERLFQKHAKSRLNSLFAGSVEGAHRYATIAGVVASAQREGLDVLAYLTWVFERRGTHRRQFGMRAAELTPAAYKHTLEHGAQQAA